MKMVQFIQGPLDGAAVSMADPPDEWWVHEHPKMRYNLPNEILPLADDLQGVYDLNPMDLEYHWRK